MGSAKPGSPTVRKAAGLTSRRYCTVQVRLYGQRRRSSKTRSGPTAPSRKR